MTGLRLVPGGTPQPPAPARATTPAPPPASPQPPAARCDCGTLPHRCWCRAKPAYDRDYGAHVEAAARMRGLPR